MDLFNNHSCCNCKSKNKNFLFSSKDNRITKDDRTFILSMLDCEIIYCLTY